MECCIHKEISVNHLKLGGKLIPSVIQKHSLILLHFLDWKIW